MRVRKRCSAPLRLAQGLRVLGHERITPQGTTVAMLGGMTVTFLLLVAFALAMFEGKNYA